VFEELDEIIEKNSSFWITTHLNPDGDSIGSETAFRRFLLSRGKKAVIVNVSPTPPELAFLDPEGAIVTPSEATGLPPCEILFSLDTALISRFEKLGEVLDLARTDIYPIDHHVPDKESLSGLIEPAASSTGEILYRFFTARGDLAPALAEPLFYAVASDTGWMQFANTTPHVLRILADLAERAGIAFDAAYTRLKNNWPLEKFRLYSEVMATLDVRGGTCAFIHCTRRMIAKYPSLPGISAATESFVEDLRRLACCEVFCLLKEKEDGSGYRASLRSRGGIDVQRLAAAFGGGGHVMAAGCTLPAPSIEEAKRLLVEKIEELSLPGTTPRGVKKDHKKRLI